MEFFFLRKFNAVKTQLPGVDIGWGPNGIDTAASTQIRLVESGGLGNSTTLSLKRRKACYVIENSRYATVIFYARTYSLLKIGELGSLGLNNS